MKIQKLLALSAINLTLGVTSANAQSTTFIDIAKGGNQICAVTTAGELICNENSLASRLQPPANVPALTQVGVGDAHACGLDLGGRAICWGDNGFDQLDVPENRVFESIDVGWNHTCAITPDLETLCWGLAANNRLEVPNDGLPFIEVDAILNGSCGLEAAGSIRCWGSPNFSWVPPSADANIETFAASSAGAFPVLCALIEGGNIECTVDSFQFPGTYSDVASWGRALCALNTDGDIECQSLANFPQTEIDALNQGPAFTKLTGHHALCAVDEAGAIACTTTASTSSTGPIQRLTDDVPLPGTQLPPDDFVAPSVVDDLRARVYSDTTVELFWTSSRKGGDGFVTGAQIFRDGELLVETNNLSSYIDNTLMPGVNYQYEVRITNSRGGIGPMGDEVTVNTSSLFNVVSSDYTPPLRPATPTNIVILNIQNIERELTWDNPPANVDVFGYEMYRNNEFIGFTTEPEFIDTTVTPFQNDLYMIIAVEEDGGILAVVKTDAGF